MAGESMATPVPPNATSSTLDSFDECIKIAVVGPQGAGKSCLVQRSTGSDFGETEPTFGVDFRLGTVPIDGKMTRLHFWDTTGAVRFAKITHAYYRIAQGIIVVYDSSDSKSLEQVHSWLEKVKSYASDSVVKILCGTKIDLLSADERTKVNLRAANIASKAGMHHVQTSSKTDQGIKQAVEALVREVRTSTVLQRAQLARKDNFGLKVLTDYWSSQCCSTLSCCMPMPWHQPALDSPSRTGQRIEAL